MEIFHSECGFAFISQLFIFSTQTGTTVPLYRYLVLKMKFNLKNSKVFHYMVILGFMILFLRQSIVGLLKYAEKNTSYHVTVKVKYKCVP